MFQSDINEFLNEKVMGKLRDCKRLLSELKNEVKTFEMSSRNVKTNR